MTFEKKKSTRIVSLDYGMARIGVALSDEQKIIASPLMTIQAEKKSDKTALKVIHELEQHQHKMGYQLEEIVIGLPLLFSGKSGMLADEVKHFIQLLKDLTVIPIISWDERLTTVQAEKALRESSMTRKKRSQYVDSVAATILLQSYLDHKMIQRDLQN